MSEEEPETSFLNRWSSRKRGAGTQASTPNEETASASARFSMPLGAESNAAALIDDPVSSDAVEQPDTIGETIVADDPGLEAEELLLTDADMPPIESLTAESNVSAFFNKGVSAALRKAALRYVFQQPRFNVRDGLNDYDGDYTVFEPLGDIVTSDMKFHAARKERDRLAAEAEAERAEELLQQDKLEADGAEKQIESDEQAEAKDEDEGEDGDQSVPDDELSPETDETTDEEPLPEADSESEATTLVLADSDDELLQHAPAFVESKGP
ncbi:MAG: hypothetical protein ACI9UN_000791 [Granulosicoccus sp.]|jgi:hypothetical protein